MPVSGSGVMLGVERLPKGVLISSPPAKSVPPTRVWQAMQSASRAMYWPFSMRLGSPAALAEEMAARPVSNRAKSIERARSGTDLEGVAGRACVTLASPGFCFPGREGRQRSAIWAALVKRFPPMRASGRGRAFRPGAGGNPDLARGQPEPPLEHAIEGGLIQEAAAKGDLGDEQILVARTGQHAPGAR